MTIFNDIDWLQFAKDEFGAKNIGGGDFYYLLQTMLSEKRMSFPQLLSGAARGMGCTVHEGLSYSLDQDWDDPSSFNEVVFFVGDVESSTLNVADYLELIEIASNAYLSFFPDDAEEVRRNFEKIVSRYRGK